MPSRVGASFPQRPAPRPLAVFLSYTSELLEYPHPKGGSFVRAAERAVIRAGHTVRHMENFPPSNSDPANHSRSMLEGTEVYVGIIGLRYGTLVRNRPSLSYTELEFEAATTLGLPRLVFLVREEALPPEHKSAEHGDRQAAFRRRLQDDSGITTASADWMDEVGVGLFEALQETDRLRRLLIEDADNGVHMPENLGAVRDRVRTEIDRVLHDQPWLAPLVVRQKDSGRSQSRIDVGPDGDDPES
jgi:uncharacterized protein DUF4062